MRLKRLFAAAAALVLGVTAVPAWAQLSETYENWGDGAAQHLMTRDEERAWTRIRSDREAQEFIDLFWARRDPSPGTPQNEWKDEFERRVKFADELFTVGRTQGSLSDRGKVIILLGAPTRRVHAGAPSQPGIQAPTMTTDDQGNLATMNIPTETWIYEMPQVAQFLEQREMEIVFVDQNSSNQWRLGRSPRTDVHAALTKARDFYLFQPGLEKVPTFTARVQTAPAAASEIKTSFTSRQLEEAVREFRALEKSPYQNVHLSYGQFVTTDGNYFVPVQLFMPKGTGIAPNASVNFFGVVENEAGEVVAVYEEPVTVAESKNDLFVDKSLELEPGEYTGTFGLAVGDEPVTIATTDMTLTAIDESEPGISDLILSNNIYALSEPQRPTDPYAFGGIKVVPKGDRTFETSDELWYFFELRNPSLDENGLPKVQVGIDVTGEIKGQKKRFRLPLSEAQPQELKGVPGHWAVGSAIPLSGFQPGDYTMEMKVIDTLGKKTWNLKNTFTVVP
ncbi:MAG TPA: GWxTD domain-containing protein [Thermoanaerobaculia bacterium]|nr:GWxTD domain-containing protein [Thermoanaerobaculia bacterium]